MSEHHHNQPTDNKDPLGKLLRELPKISAPWYFDAQLRQKLTDPSQHGKRSSFLVPAFATSIVAVIAAGFFGYYAFLDGKSDQPPSLDSLVVPQQEQPEIVVDTRPAEHASGIDESTLEVQAPAEHTGPTNGDLATPLETSFMVAPSPGVGENALNKLKSALSNGLTEIDDSTDTFSLLPDSTLPSDSIDSLLADSTALRDSIFRKPD